MTTLTREEFVLCLNNPKKLATFLDDLSTELDNALLLFKDVDIDGNTILHQAVNNPEALKSLLDFLTAEFDEDTNADLVTNLNSYGETPIHLAVTIPDSLELLLDFAQENFDDKHWDNLQAVDDNLNNIFHISANIADSQQLLLDFWEDNFSRAACYRMITELNIDGQSALHLAARDASTAGPLLDYMCACIDSNDAQEYEEQEEDYEEQAIAALTEPDSEGNTPLHLAIESTPAFDEFLEFISDFDKDKIFEMLTTQNDTSGDTVAHSAATQPTSLRLLLAFIQDNLTIEQASRIFQTKNDEDLTVLERIQLKHPKILEKFKTLYQLSSIEESSSAGKNPSSFFALNKINPEHSKLEPSSPSKEDAASRPDKS